MPHEPLAPDDDPTLSSGIGATVSLDLDRVAPGRLRATVAGDLDFVVTPTLRTRLIEPLDGSVAVLVIDLHRVTLLSAAAIEMLIEVVALAGACDAEVRVVADTRAVLRPLQLTEVDRHLAVYPSLADAWSA